VSGAAKELLIAMASGSKVRSGKTEKYLDVDELLKNLNLHGEELNEVVLAKEEVRRWPEVKWLAAGTILTRKSFSMQSLKNTLQAAWNPAQEVKFHEIEPNLFVMQAFCLGDWNRIMDDGPWLFRGCALMAEAFDGAAVKPPTPNRVQVWAQIHKIPPLFRNNEVLSQLASRVGEVVAVDGNVVQTRNGAFHRIRVKLNPAKPLTRFVPLTMEGSDPMFLQVKYEKMPKHCEHCGLMGHTYLECGTGEYEENQLQFGQWMIAEDIYWKPGTPGIRTRTAASEGGSVRGRGQKGGHGGGRFAGRSEHNQRKWVPKPSGGKKRNSGEAGLGMDREEDLEDSASSPLKQPGVTGQAEKDSGARKKLDMNAGGEIPPPPPEYITPSEKKKRMRRAADAASEKSDKGSVNSDMVITADVAASEEDRRAQ
jgi:hypothetical protein